MLKKKLGLEAIEEVNWDYSLVYDYYKIPSTLTIPESCREINSRVFWNCYQLKKVVIPESVEIIGDGAFYECSNAEIILKKPMRKFSIGINAFRYCKSVEYVKEEVGN